MASANSTVRDETCTLDTRILRKVPASAIEPAGPLHRRECEAKIIEHR
jgi:hypothetical protein